MGMRKVALVAGLLVSVAPVMFGVALVAYALMRPFNALLG